MATWQPGPRVTGSSVRPAVRKIRSRVPRSFRLQGPGSSGMRRASRNIGIPGLSETRIPWITSRIRATQKAASGIPMTGDVLPPCFARLRCLAPIKGDILEIDRALCRSTVTSPFEVLTLSSFRWIAFGQDPLILYSLNCITVICSLMYRTWNLWIA